MPNFFPMLNTISFAMGSPTHTHTTTTRIFEVQQPAVVVDACEPTRGDWVSSGVTEKGNTFAG